jgi:hypothetical protein
MMTPRIELKLTAGGVRNAFGTFVCAVDNADCAFLLDSGANRPLRLFAAIPIRGRPVN